MADKNAGGGNCPICQLPIPQGNKFFCHLCRAAGLDVRFDSGPCEAEHLTKVHTQDEIDRFDSAKTIITKPE
jgi:hypothetical protein